MNIKKKSNKVYIHESSYIDDNVIIGSGTKVWHFTHIQSGASIGKNCTLGQNVNVANNVKIGNYCKIQNNVSLYEGVILENYVFCGPSMVFTNIIKPRCKYPQRGGNYYKNTIVKEGASIGANATIICGVTIGEHSFISANALVKDNVPSHALMIGVPAVQRGLVDEKGNKLLLDSQDAEILSEDGNCYSLNKNNELIKYKKINSF